MDLTPRTRARTRSSVPLVPGNVAVTRSSYSAIGFLTSGPVIAEISTLYNKARVMWAAPRGGINSARRGARPGTEIAAYAVKGGSGPAVWAPSRKKRCRGRVSP